MTDITLEHYSAYESLKLRRHPNGVLELIMGSKDGKPGKLSTADDRMHRELADIWRDIDTDPDTRVVVIRGEGKGFYSVIAAATVGGVILCFTPTTAIEELFWSAVINGVVAVPIMAVLMRLASRRDVMGEHVISQRVRWLGWLATLCMALPVIGLALTWKS